MSGFDFEKGMEGIWDTGKETYEKVRSQHDIAENFENVERMMEKQPDKPGKVGPLNFINTLFDGVKVGRGARELHDAEDGMQTANGIHDVLDGGSGLLGNIPVIGKYANMFGMGLSTGDKMAPYVFGDGKGPKNEAASEDGQYHAHTGNGMIDNVIDATRQASNGDYADAAKNGGSALMTAEQLALNPLSLVPNAVKSLGTDQLLDGAKGLVEQEESLINPLGGASEKAGHAIGDWIMGR